jgi:ferredoxin
VRAGEEPKRPGVPGRGRVAACSGAAAVNRMELDLCGAGAVASVAAAQGVTAAGGRAAVLLDVAEADSPSIDGSRTDDRGMGAWVVHRRRRADIGRHGAFAFELLAGDAQQGVDHCLIAHHLATRLGQPGLCDLDPEIADELSLVRLPGDTDDLLRVDGLASATATTADIVLETAREAFTAVSTWTGRPCLPVVRQGPDSARYVIVAAGAAWEQACAAAHLLSISGVECAAIGIGLLNPAPADELRQAIGDAEAVAVLDPYGVTPGQIPLTTLVRGALWESGDRPIHGLIRLPHAVQDLARGLCQSFGVEGAIAPTPAAVDAAPQLAIGALPAGAWAESLLLEVAARRADLAGEAHLARVDLAGVSAITIGAAQPDTTAEQLDVLVAAHHSLLDGGNLDHLRQGSAVLILSEATGSEPPPVLAAATRAALERAGARILWLPARAAGPIEDAARLAYQGGAVLASCHGHDGAELAAGTSADLQSAGVSAELADDWIAGVAGILELPEAAPADTAAAAPYMAPEPEADPDPVWVEAVRRFHVTGSGAVSPAEPVRGLPLRPWSLTPLLAASSKASHYPVVVEGDGLVPFVEVARAGLEGTEGSLLVQHLTRLAGAVDGRAGAGRPEPLIDVFAEARADFAAHLDLSPAAATALTAELDAFANRLSTKAAVVGLGPGTLIELLARAAANARRARISAFHEDVLHLIQRLEERLRIDVGLDEADRDPAELSAALGGVLQFDIPNLAQQLTVRRGSQRLGDERRRRIDATLGQLRQFISTDEQGLPEVVLLHPPHICAGDSLGNPLGNLPDGVAAVAHDVGMEAAAGYFEAAARQLVDLFRAVRVARLEAEDRYRPEHEASLERMDWQALDHDELAMVPPVFVLETADRVLTHAMSALSTLLRSGRPLHLIILDASAAMTLEADAAGLAAAHPDLGYLAVAHRDALVLQTSLALPGHLYDGLGTVAASLRPSVAVVAVPEWSGPVAPWAQLTAAHHGRATPGFLYDPDAGVTWARRFDLQPNPQVDEPWPRLAVQVQDTSGAVIETQDIFTFAHAAAMAPRCRHAFRVIPTDAWSDEQVAIDEYLLLEPSARARRIPYLWVVANNGALVRAVMTREMAHACADRLQQWRTLQELGGHRNEYVQKAAAEARDLAAAEARSQRQELQQVHHAELEALRVDVAGEALERLAHALLAVDDEGWPAILGEGGGASGAVAVRGASEADTETASPAMESVADEAAAESAGDTAAESPEEELLEEGFIDSPMCTSCHDCINMNPRMFQYDGNKQAVLADATAGTYAQLVKAAEACPARCIHPGAPREGDATATPELIERARKFG